MLITRCKPCPIVESQVLSLETKSRSTFIPISSVTAAAMLRAGIQSAGYMRPHQYQKYDFANSLGSAVFGSLLERIPGINGRAKEGPNSSRQNLDPFAPRTPKNVPSLLDMSASAAMSTVRGIGSVVAATLKAPIVMTEKLARGLHNVPRLYGDSTVRSEQEVEDWRSGLAAANQGLSQGFYDGIAGLVTQPIAGAREEGMMGFVKGMGKGIGGLILKPAAGACEVPSYTLMGLFKEWEKLGRVDIDRQIVMGREAQGEEEYERLSEGEKSEILKAWHACEKAAELANSTSGRNDK
ncbi:hypothetical protein B0H63DRAFT_56790 [Podospora didyma]|uniref:Autophagy-related protein 2/VPS13 C-terminal domain-containing protein n=1 Tax=Podospora didyma TaxID=330526 RepID=A0AAE0P7J2_9PEZI|nr:hypothetical protein B0H63DRAFT_56790 [Podospora didyma]